MDIQSSITSIQPSSNTHQHNLYINSNSNTPRRETHTKHILHLLSTKIYQEGIRSHTNIIQQSSNSRSNISNINFIQYIKYIHLHIIYMS